MKTNFSLKDINFSRGIINEIVKRVIFYLLIISLIVNGYFILKSYYLDNSLLNNKINNVKFIPVKETIKIKGKVKTKKEKKPYAIVIDKINGKWNIDFENSILPESLTIDKIEQESKYIWYKPFRIGISAKWDKKITYNPTIAYNPLKIANFEFGAITNFKSIGLDLAYNLLDSNINLYSSYYLDNSIEFGIQIKVW